MKSKALWAKQIVRMKIEEKTGLRFGRRLAPVIASPMADMGIPVTISSLLPNVENSVAISSQLPDAGTAVTISREAASK